MAEVIRILLVEDNLGDVRLLKEILAEGSTFRFALQHTGRLDEALREVKRGTFDVMLLDLTLPDASGFETVARAREAVPQIPIVVLTGLDDEGFAIRAVREGAQDYLVKGQLDRPLLVRAIRYAVERHAQALEIEKLAGFVQQNPNPVLELDPAGQVLYANVAAQESAVALGQSALVDILPADIQPQIDLCLADGRSRYGIESRMAGRTLAWSLFPIGASRRVYAFGTDITERLNLELQLRHAQKMEAIGQLAAGLAHDFNNLLSVIQGHVHLLASGRGPHSGESLESISLASERAAGLTRQLLLFSRKQSPQWSVLHPGRILEEVSKMFRRVLGKQVLLSLEIESDTPTVSADAGMFEQALLNLAINARDAMPAGGRLTLRSEAVRLGEKAGLNHADARPGLFARITVADTGCGMDEATQGRLFEPFFTTKSAGKGTGLGLATVYGIVRQHKGWIEVESRMGHGSAFRLYFPAAHSAEGLGSPDHPIETEYGGTETILIVEDEPLLRELTRRILEEGGYTVLEAGSGLAMLQAWKERGPEIAAVVTDLLLPDGQNGRELAEGLRAQKPSLKVVLASGYTADLGEDNGDGREIYWIQKPFRPALLLRTVREALDSSE